MAAARAAVSRTNAGGAGLMLAAVSAATFGSSGVFGSSLIKAGWSPAAAVLARVTLAAIVLTIPALAQLRGQWALLRRSAGAVVAFGVLAVAGAQLCYFNAIQRMPVGVALLLEYLGTVLVVGWVWLRHGQRPRRLTIIGGIAALAGLVMVLNLVGSTSVNPIGVIWALLAAVGLASYFVLSAANEDPLPPVVMTCAAMFVAAATLALLGLLQVIPMVAPMTDVTFVGHRMSWAVPIAGLAVIAAVIPYIAGISATRRLGAKLASFIGLAEVLFAIVFAWLLLGQLPSYLQFIGGGWIIAGVAMVRLDEMRGEAGESAGGLASTENLAQWRQDLAWAENGAEEIAPLGDAVQHGPYREAVRR